MKGYVTSWRILAVTLLSMGIVASPSYAEKICIASTLNKKSGKISVSKRTAPTKCPAGSTEILDTGSLGSSSSMVSGETVRGVVGGASTSALLQFVPISLPKAAPAPILNSDIFIAYTVNLSDITGNCTISTCLSESEKAKDAVVCGGSFDAPSAPAGKLCIYVDVNYAAYDIEGQLMAKTSNPNGGSSFGAGLQWNTRSGFNSKIKASWAYTAP